MYKHMYMYIFIPIRSAPAASQALGRCVPQSFLRRYENKRQRARHKTHNPSHILVSLKQR